MPAIVMGQGLGGSFNVVKLAFPNDTPVSSMFGNVADLIYR